MTSLLLNNQMSMDRINPYTVTDTFGVSYNGGYKSNAPVVPVLETEVNDELMFVPSAGLDEGVPKNHFNKLMLNDAGNMYLKTGGVNPATSFMYPARKYQYDDGTTSWGREIIVGDAKNYVSPADFPKYSDTQKGQMMLVGAMLILLLLLLLQKFKF
jgi:hypothetical protein